MGLTTIAQSLEAISDSLKSLQETVMSAGVTINSQATSLQALSSLFGKDLPDALTGAQTAMIGAQVGAKEVEDTLTVLTSNPAFAATPYNPPVLLSTALSGCGWRLGGFACTDAGCRQQPFDDQRGYDHPGDNDDEFRCQPGTAARQVG